MKNKNKFILDIKICKLNPLNLKTNLIQKKNL